MAATAYKFLTRDARGPLSGAAWPLPHDGAPGAWVEAGAGALSCASAGRTSAVPQIWRTG
jgi:hypothetical protein